MTILYQIRRRALQIAPQVLMTCVLVYFAYHLVEGKRGLSSWHALTAELAEVKAERAAVAARRAELDHRVGRLRPDNLDPDLLEERARVMLGFGRASDFVILRSTLEDEDTED